MKTEISKATYRGHEIVITGYQANGLDKPAFFTAAHDAMAEEGPAADKLTAHTTWDEAKGAAQDDIEAILGTASTEEIEEKASDYSSETYDHVSARTAATLCDAIASARKRGTTTDTTILNYLEAMLAEQAAKDDGPDEFRSEEAARESAATAFDSRPIHRARQANRDARTADARTACLMHTDQARNAIQAIMAGIETLEHDARKERTESNVNWGHAGTAAKLAADLTEAAKLFTGIGE